MYRYQYELLKDEAIYIAGPECFYVHGYEALAAMRKRAESLGFQVTLPNDHPLDTDNPDLKKRADSIFQDLKGDMEKTTAIVCDLEAFRGSEPDSGTIYEIGMAYAKGAGCYGYTRDKRSLAVKNQQTVLKNGRLYDEKGREMPYPNLPFAPTVIGSTKIIEGDFDDCLKLLIQDVEEAHKEKGRGKKKAAVPKPVVRKATGKPVIYFSHFYRYTRYTPERKTLEKKIRELCKQFGFQAVMPMDKAKGVPKVQTDNPYAWAANVFQHFQQHVRDCDILVADLNDYCGYEVSNDVGFECGMAFQLGKKMYGYMDNAGPMIHRVPHLGAEQEFRDHAGWNVENFDYPLNLMFACSMEILEGRVEDVIRKIAADVDKFPHSLKHEA